MDLKTGKKIFYECKGSKLNIERDGFSDLYESCNVPKEIEKKWETEILFSLKEKCFLTEGSEKKNAINDYVHLLSDKDAVQFLIELLSGDLDTFTRLLICERLKNYIQHNRFNSKDDRNNLNDNILLAITSNKILMLSNPISVHISYKKQSYMKDYNFSDENIKNRIGQL